MKKLKKIVLLFIFMILSIILLSTKVQASGNLYLNKLEFYANINSDGSMDITEIWDIDISRTNTLYKTFKTDKKKYSGIQNVEVTEITNGQNKKLKKTNELLWHLDKNSYYGLKNKNGDFEIAWGVGLDNGKEKRKYKISYKVNDVISKYNDYAELYWQFIGEDFEIDAKKITGTINLPEKVKNKEDIKVWGHTEDLNGEIYATDSDKIEFEINNFISGKYVEIRTLFPTELINEANKLYNKEILGSVIKEETKWADEANAKRRQRDSKNLIITLVVTLVSAALGTYSIKKAIKLSNEVKENKKYKSTYSGEYFRDIPRENATPAQALHIYKETITGFSDNDIGKIISSTLLDLSLKKYINFNVEKENKKEKITIEIINENIEQLSSDEKVVFEFLQKACEDNKKITVKELEKYIKKLENEKIIALKTELNHCTKEELVKEKIYDLEEEKKYKKYTSENSLCIIIIFIAIMGFFILMQQVNIIGIAILVMLIISEIVALQINQKSIKKINVYTQKGINEKKQWKDLRKYMKDFSRLDKREIPEIIIWEKFLVFATVFNIADKVLEQLKIVYPNIEENLSTNNYGYMYLMINTNFSRSFTNAINNSISSAYSSASGGGGGFSGGGGGRTVVGGGGGRKVMIKIILLRKN